MYRCQQSANIVDPMGSEESDPRVAFPANPILTNPDHKAAKIASAAMKELRVYIQQSCTMTHITALAAPQIRPLLLSYGLARKRSSISRCHALFSGTYQIEANQNGTAFNYPSWNTVRIIL